MGSVQSGDDLRELPTRRRLPIINHDKRLVGIVALGDLAVNKAERQPAAKALAEISA